MMMKMILHYLMPIILEDKYVPFGEKLNRGVTKKAVQMEQKPISGLGVYNLYTVYILYCKKLLWHPLVAINCIILL